jgi:23S rRNA (cytidine1920-2'-O)/16S rRNA (cytidine1409-2'-O)-methyltransferase
MARFGIEATATKRKKRVDLLLVETGLCQSLDQARRLVMAGKVRIGSDHVVPKASEQISLEADLRVDAPCPYVSRGAYKLLNALDQYLPELPENAVVLDIGASTGGFTDLLLQRGAIRSYAVDVGHGQLHYRLQQDPRVLSLEKTNARSLDRQTIPEPIDIITADVSFISVTKVLPACAKLLKPGAWAFILVKPQFEARREEIAPGGVVRSESVRERCVQEVCQFAQSRLDWTVCGVVPSAIKGPKGNQEYLCVFRS